MIRSALAAIVVLAALAPAVGAQEPPVLGSPDYVQPAKYGRGWGEVAPRQFFNGGVPSGMVFDIAWTGWGEQVATGTGKTWLYMPSGGYFRAPGRVALRVEAIGTCPGHDRPAYTLLFIRRPSWPGGPLGPWHKWSGSRTTCDFREEDPAYAYPRRPPGFCRDVGPRRFVPGKLFDVIAHEIPCADARRTARTIAARAWPARCRRTGCARQLDGLRCRLERLRRGEISPDFTVRGRRPFPVQRVACVSAAGGNFTGWLIVRRRVL